MNSITDLLDLEDTDIYISDISIQDNIKVLTLETLPAAHFCPQCGYRMHSRGIYERWIVHPVLQDGYNLKLRLKQRRWRCTRTDCKYESNESFRFVNKHRRRTNASDMLIVLEFKHLDATAASIAQKFHTSDTHVLEIFDRYVKMDRLPLTDIISVDEVHTNMSDNGKYALVIQDFYTGDPIDLLRSRRSDVTEPYFVSIPREERLKVKYLLSDMYNPYIRYVDKYFPNAVAVVDSFHVIQWMIHLIDQYIRTKIKEYKLRDRLIADKKSEELGHRIDPPLSNEVYLLQKYRWLILANQSNIEYHSDPRMDKHYHALMNTYDYERALFSYFPRLLTLRDLKEKYVSFNSRNAGNPVTAAVELDKLIHEYATCGDSIFETFSSTLQNYREYIINSFIVVQKYGPGGMYDARLSNGPIESLNRKIKDLKRSGHGYRNFEHFRNRFLYATRSNPVLDATSDAQVLYFEVDDDE